MAGLHGLSGHLITGYDSCLVPGTIEIPAKAPGEVGQVCYCYTLGRWEHKKNNVAPAKPKSRRCPIVFACATVRTALPSQTQQNYLVTYTQVGNRKYMRA